ncbi:MAG: thioredoxin domain-containing protein [Candidatus Diapherotrites archaeon]|nr:thioredoxin domain-containing protein [Candidatus Diapherotrites archaeon]
MKVLINFFGVFLSKLKEMKKEVKEKPGMDFSLVFLAALGLIIFAILFFSFFGTPSATAIDPVELVDDDPFKGPASAKVTIVEFSDFQCPACGAAYPVLKQLTQEYFDRVKFVYRDFPLSAIHPFAQKAAEAAACANKQGKFWEYHDALFENQQKLAVVDLKKYAADLGLNTADFAACLEQGEFALEVSNDAADAGRFGVRATPTFFINGKMYSNMPYSRFKEIIDQELAKQ